MTSHLSTAEYRRLFQRAVRENTTVAEARRREAEERWTMGQRRLVDKRCGTRSEPADQPVPQFWWKDQ